MPKLTLPSSHQSQSQLMHSFAISNSFGGNIPFQDINNNQSRSYPYQLGQQSTTLWLSQSHFCSLFRSQSLLERYTFVRGLNMQNAHILSNSEEVSVRTQPCRIIQSVDAHSALARDSSENLIETNCTH